MPLRICLGCGLLFDAAATGTQRCPTCQAGATARRNTRPSSSSRGYDGEYQRNRAIIVARALASGEACVLCHKPCQPGQKITAEHLTALRDGGTSVMSNLGPAHSKCNTGWNRGHSR
jgi:hypothetical protein